MNKKIAAALVMAVAILSVSAANVKAETSGWKAQGSQWYYYNSNGTMKTGWLYDGGSWYYLKSSGEMAIGWMEIDGTWYYFNDNGSMKDDGWLRLNENGESLDGEYDGKEYCYYLNSDGSMKTGWLKKGDDWYYLKSNGEMTIYWIYINDKWYCFDYKGKMLTGWNYTGEYRGGRYLDNTFYYFSKDGEWIENTKDFYKVRTEKDVYDVDDKEIKFTFTNNSDTEYAIIPEARLKVIKDGIWQPVLTRDDIPSNFIRIQGNSEKICSLDANCLLGGKFEVGKYRIEEGIGESDCYSEFEVTSEKEAPDVIMKMDSGIYYIDDLDESKNVIGYSIINNSDKDISVDENYKIQMIIDGQWKDVPLKSDEFNDAEVLIKSKETYEASIPMGNIKSYGDGSEELDLGTYRIVKEINGQEVCSEFNVESEGYTVGDRQA